MLVLVGSLPPRRAPPLLPPLALDTERHLMADYIRSGETLLQTIARHEAAMFLDNVDPAMFNVVAEAIEIAAPDLGRGCDPNQVARMIALLAMNLTAGVLACREEWLTFGVKAPTP